MNVSLTNDSRSHIEYMDASIVVSKDEEERELHWYSLKLSWPGVAIDHPEIEWDKRDLVDLYENIKYKRGTVSNVSEDITYIYQAGVKFIRACYLW